MAARYTLSAGERLKREQHIKALFRSGKALSAFPLRLIWLLVPKNDEASVTRAGFSAPKKKFKHATDRNRIKRVMREVWRLQKLILEPVIPEGMQLHIFLLFIDVTLPDYDTVFAAAGKAIAQLKKTLDHAQPPE